MRYWVVLLIYVIFSVISINLQFVHGCSETESGVITGAACSIKEIRKENTQNKPKDDNKDIKNSSEKKIKTNSK